jgi:hypothetical protein
MEVRTGLAFLLAILFAVMLFQSRRFIEYFPAFALIFAASAWSPILEKGKSNNAEAKFGTGKFHLRTWLPIVVLSICLIIGGWLSTRGAIESLQDTKPYSTYAQAASWLAENTPQGARVFQTDWDDFPRIFFYNTWNTYLVGLDPTYLQLKDSQLYDQWVDITRGEREHPSGLIAGSFAAEYVFSDLSHDNFMDRAQEDPAFHEVYRDQEAVIYRLDISN